jgi:hypothetical protein
VLRGSIPQPSVPPARAAELLPAAAPPDSVAPRHIETPQQAAQLPVFNAAVVGAVVPYAVAAVIGGFAMQAALHLQIGSTVGDIVYRMDNPAAPSLQAVGTIDDHTFKENWAVDDQGLHITGSYGSTPEDLRLDRADSGWRLHGSIGDFEVEQHVTWQPSHQTLSMDGSIGGVPYQQAIAIHNNPSMPELSARGSLGQDAIKVGAMAMPHHAKNTIDVSGDGTLIGQPLQMEGTVRMLAPGTHPAVNLQGTLEVDDSSANTMRPGQSSHWQVRFSDANTHTPVLDFDTDHEKYMHMVIVSRDLKNFAHVHPTYDPSMGHFDMKINVPSSDPDNQDSSDAVTRAGPYLVYTEVKPRDADVTTRAFTVQASGTERPQPLTPDPTQSDGSIRKYFTADGQPGKVGDAYEVTLTRDTSMPGMVHLNYKLRQAGDNGYEDVTDLQPWLGMMGHGIVISGAGAGIEDKYYAHVHAGHDDRRHPSTGPDETFMLDKVPPSGIYKMWAQFKHHGNILTLPFVFTL